MLSQNLFDEKTLEVNFISNYLTVTTPLPQYLPYPRFLLDTDLSHTAKLLYTLLLDRATLSQKNNWMDERGFVYVIFPLSSLSDALRCSTMSIKRALRSLEDADLIERRRGHIAVPNNIFVKVPTEQECSSAWNDSAPCDGTEMISSMEQKCSTNQRYKNNLKDSHLIKTTAAPLTFGEYHNVFLTEKEYKQLKADFFGLDSLIEQLSAISSPQVRSTPTMLPPCVSGQSGRKQNENRRRASRTTPSRKEKAYKDDQKSSGTIRFQYSRKCSGLSR